MKDDKKVKISMARNKLTTIHLFLDKIYVNKNLQAYETRNVVLEVMNTLICSAKPTLYISNFAPCKPKIPALYKLNPPLSRTKTHANAKGFSGSPSTVGSEISSNKSKKNNEDDDDEIPQEVFNRIIVRILVSVGFPMGLGLAILHVIGVLKEQHLWDVPMWLPFLTTFLTFGASTLGIAYGTLSTSLDAERKGSLLGLEEVEKNWVEMWKEEDQNKR